MGKVKTCFIAMSNPWLVYRPGDFVSGTATVEIKGHLKVRKIGVKCKGQALTQWGVAENEGNKQSKEVYCNMYTNVYTANPSALMAAGVYKYNFTFKLPREGLPSSFEGYEGAIRYWIKVEVDKPFPRRNDRFYKPFTVLANIDLNQDIYLRPIHDSAQKPLSKVLGIGHAGTLTASLSLDRSGFCPGEKICINLEATNDSTKDLGLLKASLVQMVHYKAANSTYSTVCNIRTLLGHKLGKGKREKWTDELMPVDLVPPSSESSTCQIIQVSYMVRMVVEVPLGRDLVISIPIRIGTVPIVRSMPSEVKLSVSDSATHAQYAQCVAGFKRSLISTRGFPRMSYTPRTIIVKPTNKRPLTTDKHKGTSTSFLTGNLKAIVNKSSVTVAASRVPPATEPSYSNAVRIVTDVVVDSTHATEPLTHTEASDHLMSPTPVTRVTPQSPSNGSILIVLFPCTDTPLVLAAFKRHKLALHLCKGRVLAYVSKMQLLPSQQTAAVIVCLDTEGMGLNWLRNMARSNSELSSRWHALIGENNSPNKYFENTVNRTYMSMTLFGQTKDIKYSRNNWDQYNLLLPVNEKLETRTFVLGKVKFAYGDWGSFSSKASELTVVVTAYPDRESRLAFLQESDASLEIARFY